jgi:phage terminase small subunit
VLAAQLEIATADPRAVVHTTKHACRNCHGIDGEYHWRDPQEFDKACAAELDASAEQRRMPHMPSDDGGYGYTMHRAPNPECESCGGSGQTVTHIADMRELSDSAAKLIKGVKQDRFGAVTVELRDQDAAWREVARILGAYKDSLTVTPRPPAPVEIPADTPREKVGEAYLALVTG